MFKQIATLLFDLSMCKRILCLCSKFEVHVPGSRARLGIEGSKGKRKRSKEEQETWKAPARAGGCMRRWWWV